MKINFNKGIALVLIVSQLCACLPALEFMPELYEGYQRLEQYLDRANVERSLEKWERLAEAGVLAAMNAWESSNLYLKENNEDLYIKHKNSAFIEYNITKEKAYVEWVSSKVFREKIILDGSRLSSILKQEAKNWLFINEENSNGTRNVQQNDAITAQNQWERQSGRILEDYILKWEKENASAQAELYYRLNNKIIDDTELKELLEKQVNNSKENMINEYKRIARSEGNLLMFEVLFDKKSLKHLSANEAAAFIAKEKAQEAENATNEVIDKLFKEMDNIIELPDQENIELEVQNCLAKFRIVFEEGLKKWDEAELKFLAARTEWESNATEEFFNSEKIWTNAYAELNSRRNKWEEGFLKKLDEGHKVWKSRQEYISNEIAQAREDFLVASSEAKNTKLKLVEIQIEIYNKSRALMASASEGIDSWCTLWGPKYNSIYSYWRTNCNDSDEDILPYEFLNSESFKNETSLEKYIMNISFNELIDDTSIEKIINLLSSLKEAYLSIFKDLYLKTIKTIESDILALNNNIARLKNDLRQAENCEEQNTSNINRLIGNINSINSGLSEKTKILESLYLNQDSIMSLTNNTNSEEINSIMSSISNAVDLDKINSTLKEKFIFDKALFDSDKNLIDKDFGWLFLAKDYKNRAEDSSVNMFRLCGCSFETLDFSNPNNCSNELYTEYLKSKAVLKYWEEELEVAKVLDEYAQSNSSTLEEANTTIEVLNIAKTNYELELVKYNAMLQSMYNKNNEIDIAYDLQSVVEKELEKLQHNVEKARQDYAQAIACFSGVNPSQIFTRLDSLILSLDEIWSLDKSDLNIKYNFLLDYYNNANELAEALHQKEIFDQISMVLNGTVQSENGLSSLSMHDLEKKQIEIEHIYTSDIFEIREKLWSLYPEELYNERALIESLFSRYKQGNSLVNQTEKKEIEHAIKQLWLCAAQYYAQALHERHVSISILSEGAMFELDKEYYKEAEARAWLHGQLVGVSKEIEFETSSGREIDFADLKEKLELLLRMENKEEFFCALDSFRKHDEVLGRIIRKEYIFELTAGSLALLEYKSRREEYGLNVYDNIENAQKKYESYCLEKQNYNNQKARQKIAGFIQNLNNELINENCYSENIKLSITNLRSASDGLSSAGIEALENYISGVLEYLAIKDLYSNKATYELEGYENAYLELTNQLKELLEWNYDVYNIETIFELPQSSLYSDLSKEERSVFCNYAAILILRELGQNELKECCTARDLYRVINSYDLIWAKKFNAIKMEDKEEIYKSIAAIYNIQNNGSLYDIYTDWNKKYLEEKTMEEAKLLQIYYSNNAEVSNFYRALEFINSYISFFSDNEDLEIEAVQEMYKNTVVDNNWTEFYNLVNKENISAIKEFWFPFYLAGKEILYTFLSSPTGFSYIEIAIPYLRTLDTGLSERLESYYRKEKAFKSYSILVDGDIIEWLDNYNNNEKQNALNQQANFKISFELNKTEYNEVYDRLKYGIYLRGVEYYKQEEQEQLSDKLSKLSNLFLIKNRNLLLDIIAKKHEKTEKERQIAADEHKYAIYINNEENLSRINWISELEFLNTDKKDPYDASSFDSFKESFNSCFIHPEEALYKQLLTQVSLYAAYFTDETCNYNFKYNANYNNPPYFDSVMNKYVDSKNRYFSFSYNENRIINDIHENIKILKNLYLSEDEIKLIVLNANKHLNLAMNELDAYYEESFLPSIENIKKAYSDYNEEAKNCNIAYENLLKTRLELRKAQEKKEWAESIYLKNFEANSSKNYQSPKEKYSEIKFKYERAKTSFEILEALKDKKISSIDTEYSFLFDNYKIADNMAYISKVIAYEVKAEIAIQEEKIREAEKNEAIAKAKLVRSVDPAEPLIQNDKSLVFMQKTDEGEYNFYLAYEVKKLSESIIDPETHETYTRYFYKQFKNENCPSNPDDYFSYYNSYNIELKKLDGVRLVTQAEKDASEWLDYIYAQGEDYLNEIMLASLYIKAMGSQENRDFWFKNEADPNFQDSKDNYSLNNIPLDRRFHGEDIGNIYRQSRFSVMQEAYFGLLEKSNGEEDLTKYLIFRDHNVMLDSAMKEKLLLETAAINKMEKKLNKEKLNNMKAAAANFALASILTLAAIPFFPLLLIPATCAFIIGGTFAFKAAALAEIVTEINSVEKGKSSLLSAINSSLNNDYYNWSEKQNELSEEKCKLNRMLYGIVSPDLEIKDKENVSISYDSFIFGLEELLNKKNCTLSINEAKKIFSEEEFINNNYKDTGSIMACLDAYISKLETCKNTAMLNLNERELFLQQKQNNASQLFYNRINENMKINEDTKLQLKELAFSAADINKSSIERLNAANKYDELFESLMLIDPDYKIELSLLANTAWGAESWNSAWRDFNYTKQKLELHNSFVHYTRDSEKYTKDIQKEIALNFKKTLENEQSLELELKEKEWELHRQNYDKQYAEWLKQVEEIKRIASQEWDRAVANVNKSYNTWKRKFQDEYTDKTSKWENNYLAFAEAKQEWVNSQYLYATNVRNYKLIEHSGNDPEVIIADALAKTSIQNIKSKGEFQSDNYILKLLGDTNLNEILTSSIKISEKADEPAIIIPKGNKRLTSIDSYTVARAVLQNINTDMKQSAAKLAAQQAKILLEDSKKMFFERLEQENKDMWEWEKDMVLNSGYAISNNINRSSVVDSTTFGPIHENQFVHRYEAFTAESPVINVCLEETVLADLDENLIILLLDSANRDLEQWAEKVFGRIEDNCTQKQLTIPRTISKTASAQEYSNSARQNNMIQTESRLKELSSKIREKGYEALSSSEKDEFTRLSRETATIRDGELGAHIGYAPLFKNDPDIKKNRSSNIEDVGAGQLGRILLDFIWNDMVNAHGYAELAKPMYDQKMWAGEGPLGFTAPSLRDVVDIATEICADITGQKWLSYTDDLLFAGLDLSGGYKTADELGKELAAKLISAGVASGSGALGSKLSSGLNGVTKVLANSGLSMATAYTQSVAGGYLAAMDFSKFGTQDWIDHEAAKSVWTSSSTIANTLSRGVSTGISAGMGLMNLGEGAVKADGFNIMQICSMSNLNSLAGGLASSAINYAMLGEATFNVLNLDLLGLRGNDNHLVKHGLLELSIGKNGVHSKIGSSGVDISMGNISSALYGVQNWNKNINIEKAAESFKMEGLATTLRTQWGFGDKEAKTQLDSILKGETQICIAPIEAEAVSTIVDGKKVITINSKNEKIADRNEKLQLGVILAHEAHRDGIVSEKEIQKAETKEAVIAHTEMLIKMAKDEHYANSMKGIIGSSDNYKRDIIAHLFVDTALYNNYIDTAYDSSNDFWKLMANGDLVDDGEGWLKDQNGEYLYDKNGKKIGANGKETGLLNILFGGTHNINYDQFSDEQIYIVQSLMEKSGMIHSGESDSRTRTWNDTYGKTLSANSILNDFGNTVATQVFMNCVDELSNTIVFGNSSERGIASATVSDSYLKRLLNFTYAKMDFYGHEHLLFNRDDMKKIRWTEDFAASDLVIEGEQVYLDGAHKGIDLAGPEGTEIKAYYSGKVAGLRHNTTNSGYSVILEYGFNFEDTFYSTGVLAQFMHLQEDSTLKEKDFCTKDTIIGKMGNTGASTGTHLHYQLMGDNAGMPAGSSAWEMYSKRRDTFLKSMGLEKATNYSTSPTNYTNYYSDNSKYKNYYYNPNNFREKWGFK